MRLGTPSLVITKGMGLECKEVTAVELDNSASQLMLRNCPPDHLYVDIFDQIESKAFCRICNKRCTTRQSEASHLLMAGYPCNSYSQMHPKRFGQDCTNTEHSDVLKGVAQLILKDLPKMFILENVSGIKKSRGGDHGDRALDWVYSVLKEVLGERYRWITVQLPSTPLHHGVVKFRYRGLTSIDFHIRPRY